MTLNTNRLEQLIKERKKNAVEINLARHFLFSVKENNDYSAVNFWLNRYNIIISTKKFQGIGYNKKLYMEVQKVWNNYLKNNPEAQK